MGWLLIKGFIEYKIRFMKIFILKLYKNNFYNLIENIKNRNII